MCFAFCYLTIMFELQCAEQYMCRLCMSLFSHSSAEGRKFLILNLSLRSVPLWAGCVYILRDTFLFYLFYFGGKNIRHKFKAGYF